MEFGLYAGTCSRTKETTIMSKQVTIDGEIKWYDYFLLDYDVYQFMDAVDDLKLNVGDKIKITISKAE